MAEVSLSLLSQHCTAAASEISEEPGATAGSCDLLILVELPLPWPSKIEDHVMLAGALAGRSTTSCRIQAIKAPASRVGHHRVIACRRGSALSFAGMERQEVSLPAGEVGEYVSALCAGEAPRGDLLPIELRDVLVCSHGSRDRCCGRLGTKLEVEVAAARIRDARIWRTSHLGGHRFSPTAMTLPDGLVWAWLDAPLLTGILDRTVPPDLAVSHHRGCIGFADRLVQMADREALRFWGWQATGWRRAGTVELDDGVSARVRIDAERPGAPPVRLTALVTRGRELPVPHCGAPSQLATKTTVELIVEAVAVA